MNYNLFTKKYYTEDDLHNIIKFLLTQDVESDFFDFKWCFYLKEDMKLSDMWNEEEILKDIFSFHNTTHNTNSFIICGVEDETNKVVGTKKLTLRQIDQIQRYFHNIGNYTFLNHRLNVELKQITYEEKNIIIIILFNSNEVPIYLTSGKNKKLYNKLFVRIGESKKKDWEIPDSTIQDLWKKKFNLNLNKLEYFYEILKSDFGQNDFKPIEQDNKDYYLYLNEPLYKFNLETAEDQYDDFDYQSFNLLQKKIKYSYLNIYYNNSKMEEILLQKFNQNKYYRCSPNEMVIKNGNKIYTVYYYLLNDNNLLINKLLNTKINLGQNIDKYECNLKTPVVKLEEVEIITTYLEENIKIIESGLKNEITKLYEEYKEYGELQKLNWDNDFYYDEAMKKIITLIIFNFKNNIIKSDSINNILDNL